MSGCGYFPWPSSPPPSGPPVAFDWNYFQSYYPELITAGQAFSQLAFNEACMYCDNTGAGPVPNLQGGQTVPNPSGAGAFVNPLYVALHNLTAHIVFLRGSIGGLPASTLVGRIASAGEGSVNVSTEYRAPTSVTEAWLSQTKYGAAYWASVQQYKFARYRGAPRSARGRTWP